MNVDSPECSLVLYTRHRIVIKTVQIRWMGWIFFFFFLYQCCCLVIYFNQIHFIQIQCEVWCWLFSFFPSLFWKLCIIPSEECIFPLELSLSDKNWFFSSNPLCMQDGDHWELEVCSFCIYFSVGYIIWVLWDYLESSCCNALKVLQI